MWQNLRGGCILLPFLVLIGCGAVRQPAPVSGIATADRMVAAHAPSTQDLAFAAPLSRGDILRAVAQRNPDIAMARAAWRAALARVPQRAAWDDPTLSYRIAPATIGHGNVGEEIQLSQRIPIGGEPELQREIARAEVDARRSDVGAVRQRLLSMASQIYDDDALATQSLALVDKQRALIDDLRRSATAHVATGTASIQAPLQAEDALASLAEQAIGLARDRQIAETQLNALLHRNPDLPLPNPGPCVALPAPTGQLQALEETALRMRPELAGAQADVVSGQAAIRAAHRLGVPDVGVSASYSSMWMDSRQQYMVGVSVAVPLHRDRIRGAVQEAQATLDQSRLALEHLDIDIRAEVVEAYRRAQADQSALAVIVRQREPAIRTELAAARTGLANGNVSFAAALDLARALLDIRLHALRTTANLNRHLADMARAIGQDPGAITKDTP